MKTSALFAASLLALAAAGCAKNMTSIQIAEICFPPDDASKCAFAATCARQLMGNAAIDTGSTQTLVLAVQVDNHTEDNADADTFRANSHDAYVEEVNVEYESTFFIPSVRQRVGPFVVRANDTNVIEIEPVTQVSGDAIQSALAATAAPVGILAKVRLNGHYQDQSAFETAEWDVAVDVCNGCGDFDPAPCTTGIPVALCPNNPGQQPLTVKCQ